MTWNYRVLRQVQNGEPYLAIYEVYYDKNGRANAMTANPIAIQGETLEELMEAYKMQAEAFAQPVLDYDKIPEPDAEPM